jgi:hypothetical protein
VAYRVLDIDVSSSATEQLHKISLLQGRRVHQRRCPVLQGTHNNRTVTGEVVTSRSTQTLSCASRLAFAAISIRARSAFPQRAAAISTVDVFCMALAQQVDTVKMVKNYW